MCDTKASAFWYKGPSVWTNRFLCDSCGLYWRKYAAEQSPTDLVATNPRKHIIEDNSSLGVAPPIKLAKVPLKAHETNKVGSGAHAASSSSAAASSPAATPLPPPPPARLEPIRCVMCRKMEPKKRLQQCRQCSLSVHQGCFGLTDEEVAADVWFCEACTNERTLDAALVPRCTLCPPLQRVDPTKAAAASTPKISAATVGASKANGSTTTQTLTPANSAAGSASRARNADGPTSSPLSSTSAATAASNEPPLSVLDAFKPTECNNWAHAVCAVWMPDVLFTDTERLKLVEGVGNLPFWRYAATCEVCNRPGGACIQCSDSGCKRTFHVSCAYAHSGYSFGFEINPVKTSRRDQVVTAGFKNEQGHWSALAYCKTHKELIKEKQTYDLAEVDPKTGLTALQTYVRTHKGAIAAPPQAAAGGANAPAAASAASSAAAGDATYALLRRAKRFDAVFGETEGVPKPGPPPTAASAPATPARLSSSSKPISSTPLGPASRSNGAPAPPKIPKPYPKHCVRCDTTFSPIWWPVSNRSTATDGSQGSSQSSSSNSHGTTRPPSSQQPKERAVCCNICRTSLESVAEAAERRNDTGGGKDDEDEEMEDVNGGGSGGGDDDGREASRQAQPLGAGQQGTSQPSLVPAV